MKIEITLNTDNAAFEENCTEVERILIETAQKISAGITQGILRDYNGNKVGTFTTGN